VKNPEISKLSKIEAMNLRKVKLMRKFTTRLTIYTLLTIILTACQAVPTLAPPTEPPAQATPTRAATATVEPPPEPTPSATNQPPVYVYQGNADLPEGLEQLVAQQNLPQPQGSPNEIAYSFDFNNANPVGNWVYALVAPFPTVSEEVSFDWLRNLWQGQPEDVINTLLVNEDDLSALSSVLGEPADTVRSAPKDHLLESAWTAQHTWAIIPFENLEPRWKVLSIDGQSPIHKDFGADQYPLNIQISASPIGPGEDFSLPPELEAVHLSNLDSSKITTVMLTGVTALVRATAVGMDQRGVLAPAEHLAPIMQEADILHISNEVPFAENCPAHTTGSYLVFCSPENYMELLRYIGTDIVELTGDHFQDYGEEGMLYTLELYQEEGLPVYGGGKDIFDARAPVKLEVNGNKIAFIGCNAKSPNFARASETSTGAYHCDMDYMAQAVRDLRDEGYLPIATFQHEEVYTWSPVHAIERDFKIVADAGAIIASGSQAHVPHYAEFYDDTFFHYGLGNLFFDQYGIQPNTDIGFLDRHVFYKGKYLGVELIPIQFLDKVQARLMTAEEKAETLAIMFDTYRMWWKDESNQPVMPSRK
jgi:poly-gamma-glutamate synthesis protein (capsule biosynthesis protein)